MDDRQDTATLPREFSRGRRAAGAGAGAQGLSSEKKKKGRCRNKKQHLQGQAL